MSTEWKNAEPGPARPSPAPRHRKVSGEEPATPEPAPVAPPECLLGGCTAAPEWRGLCAAHRQTHRGLAAPKEGRDD